MKYVEQIWYIYLFQYYLGDVINEVEVVQTRKPGNTRIYKDTSKKKYHYQFSSVVNEIVNLVDSEFDKRWKECRVVDRPW